METGIDFVLLLENDVSAKIMKLLDEPSDLVSASSVSRSWRRLVVTHSLCKELCLRKVPALSNIARVVEVNDHVEGAFRNPCNSDALEREHQLYSSFMRAVSYSRNNSKICLPYAVGASSTERYPDHSIIYTLLASSRYPWGCPYWSSIGQTDSDVPEHLLYKFSSGVSVVTEIGIRPHEVIWADERPVDSAMSVRFRMGHAKSKSEMEVDVRHCPSEQPAEKYEWTYTSPEFPMLQESSLQVYKLPQPAVNIGGFLLIELIGRAHREMRSRLFYIRIDHVGFLARSLLPEFDVEMEASGELILKYCHVSHWRDVYELRAPSANQPEPAQASEDPDWMVPVSVATEVLEGFEVGFRDSN